MIYFYHVTRAKASKQRRGGRTWPSSATLHRQMTAWGRRCKANHGRHTASAKGKTVSEEGNGVRGGKRCQGGNGVRVLLFGWRLDPTESLVGGQFEFSRFLFG